MKQNRNPWEGDAPETRSTLKATTAKTLSFGLPPPPFVPWQPLSVSSSASCLFEKSRMRLKNGAFGLMRPIHTVLMRL